MNTLKILFFAIAGLFVTSQGAQARSMTKFDSLECLVDSETKPDLFEIEALGVAKAGLPVRSVHMKQKPWRDYHWRLSHGLLSKRTNSEIFSAHIGWKSKYNYIRNQPFVEFFERKPGWGRDRDIKRLSPNEKMDLWMGDKERTLTFSNWEIGEKFLAEGHSMTISHGVCEGTAPASVAYPEPKRPVTVKSPAGDITFDAVEIKGEASLLWAEISEQQSFKRPIVGEHCNHVGIAKHDLARGYSACSEQDCFDVNPAVAHFALAYLMPLKRNRVIIDRDTHYGIFNSPVVRHRFHYYNIANGNKISSLDPALLTKYAQHRNLDPFARLRSPDTVYVVGVKMEMVVGNVSWLRRLPGGLDGFTRNGSVDAEELHYSYDYDLELDGHGNLLGGEWRGGGHPDFLFLVKPRPNFTPVADAKLASEIVNWDISQPIPESWLPAIRESTREGVPPRFLVEALVEESSGVPKSEWFIYSEPQ